MHDETAGGATDPDTAAQPRWRASGWWAGQLLLVAGFALAIGGCDESEQGDASGNRPKPVTTVTARTETLRETATGIGSFQAIERVEIRAEVAGLVRKVYFDEGQHVAADELLFRLDDQELQRRRAARQAAREAAQAERTNAQWKFDRVRKLREEGVAAIEEFKEARDRYRSLSAEVERLAAELKVIDEQIADTRIRAPFSGRMTEHLVDVGDFVDVGDHLASLYRIDPIELSFHLPERFADKVQPGQAMTAASPAFPDREFDGELHFVSPVIDPQTREFHCKARLPNPNGALKPGIFATAHVIITTHADQPVVPEECLVSMRDGYSVFVVEEGVARLRDVKVGVRKSGRVGVRDGLQAGETVVRTGHMQLVDGDKVRLAGEGQQDAPSPSASAQSADNTNASSETEQP